MPKIVDHEKQKQLVAEAAWRIIRRDGLERVSVRYVAEEAGLSPGSLRHYFNSQSELLEYSMSLVSDRVKNRALQHADDSLLTGITSLTEELLPLDDERRAEMEVWFAFTAKAMSDQILKPLSQQVYREMRGMFTIMIKSLIEYEIAKPDIDPELEAKRLHAMVDGLAIHGISQPEDFTSEQMRAIVLHHLQSLLKDGINIE
ncbi:TetR family transcriptional regulator [Paenibacillus sp. CAA11]|uniref:TetR/AcrR family transcriptional regulator n=1 Tax=Paenibacillus sp. CAA11 TaxID=1532905 RepID=UPI000D34BC73|nr:TetR/AcrR family transcriptional regulator [Paenibacillus sp. CAA11]AWB42845.1 TetR family transcriptional regulator [Paenibacillus sp. CAA11]